MQPSSTPFGLDATWWTAIGAIASCVYCVAFIGSLIFIYRQLGHMAGSTMATAFSKAVEILQDENRREDCGIVFFAKDKPVAQWDEKEKRAGERVCHSYDQVGIMIRSGMFRKELIVDSWGDSLRRIWPILKPLVEEHRTRKSKELWDDFEWLAQDADKFVQKRKPWWKFWA